MRLKAKFGGEAVRFMAYSLCSENGVGDYECFPNKEVALELMALGERLIDLGFDIEGVNEQICLARKGQLQLTAFPTGRVILEGVSPDTPRAALELAAELLQLEEAALEE